MGVLWGQDRTAAWIIPKVIWIKVGTTDLSLLTYWQSFLLSLFLFLSHNVLTQRGISDFLPDLPQYFELAAFGVQVIEHEDKGDWRIYPRTESVLFQPLFCWTLYFHVFQTANTESGFQNKAFHNKAVQTSC